MAALAWTLEEYFDIGCGQSIGASPDPACESSLDVLADLIPTERHHFATGTRVFDRKLSGSGRCARPTSLIPKDGGEPTLPSTTCIWSRIRSRCAARMSMAELRPHSALDPQPAGMRSHTCSLLAKNWGFCLPDRELPLPDGEYEVVIDSELRTRAASREIGEAGLSPGESEDEVLFSSYLCHPSLANDGLPAAGDRRPVRPAERTFRRGVSPTGSDGGATMGGAASCPSRQSPP